LYKGLVVVEGIGVGTITVLKWFYNSFSFLATSYSNQIYLVDLRSLGFF